MKFTRFCIVWALGVLSNAVVAQSSLPQSGSWATPPALCTLAATLMLTADEPQIVGPAHILRGKPYAFLVRGGEVTKGVWTIQSRTDDKPVEMKGKEAPEQTLAFPHSGRFKLGFKFGKDKSIEKDIVVYDFTKLEVVRRDGKEWNGEVGFGEVLELKVRNSDNQSFGPGIFPPLKVTVEGSVAFAGEDGEISSDSSRELSGGEPFKVVLKSTDAGWIKVSAGKELDASDFDFPTRPVVATMPAGLIPTVDKPRIRIRAGQSEQIKGRLTIAGKEPARYSWSLNEGADHVQLENSDGGTTTIKAVRAGSAVIRFTATINGTSSSRDVPVEVMPRASTLQVVPALTQLVPRQTTSVELRLLDENGGPVPIVGSDSGKVSVTVSKPDVLKVVRNPAASSGMSFLVEAIQEGSADISFTLTLDASASDPISTQQTFKVSTISEFLPIEVSLKQLDDATVRNTFGTAISRDYFVLEVNLINKLRALSNGIKVDSILVYGQSFDVGIDMVKLVSEPRGKGRWEPVTFGDVTREFTLAHSNKENPYPVELSSHPLGSVVISRSGTSSRESVDGVLSRNITMTRGESVSIRLAKLPDMRVSCESGDSATIEADGTILKAVGLGQTSVKVTIKYVDGKDEKCATAVFTIRVMDDKGSFLNNWSTSGELSPILISTSNTYVLQPPAGQRLADIEFRSSRAVDLDRATGTLKSVTPGDVLVSAISKANGSVSYMSLRFIEPTTALVLPPSVFEGPDGPIQIKAALRYKPVSQELVLLSQDRREATSPQGTTRSLVDFGFKILGWTFAQQAIGNMKPSLFQDDIWPGVLALGPQMAERFLPDNSSAHRNAILTQGMKEVEAIPFGGNITKVVFFPKSVLSGYLRDHKVRIAAIDSTSFRIAVGAVTSLDQLDQRNVPPPVGTAGAGGSGGQGGG